MLNKKIKNNMKFNHEYLLYTFNTEYSSLSNQNILFYMYES